MPLVTCPDCGKQISDQAPACPNCGRPMASPPSTSAPPTPPAPIRARRKTPWVALGCLSLLVSGALGIIITESTSPSPPSQPTRSEPVRPGPVWKTDPHTGQRYMARPISSVPEPTDVKPLIHVRALLAAPPARVKAELLKQLGPKSNPRWDAKDLDWDAKANFGSVTVAVFRGRVVGVTVNFAPPARDRGAALAAIDLQHARVEPSADGLRAAYWYGVLGGIDEVWCRYSADWPAITVAAVGVIPDERLEKELEQSN